MLNHFSAEIFGEFLKNKGFWMFENEKEVFVYRHHLYIIFYNQSLLKIYRYFSVAKQVLEIC